MELAAVLESMADGVFVCDAAGELVAVNRTALRILGVSSLAEAACMVHQPWHLRNARHLDGSHFLDSERPMARVLAGEPVVEEVEVFPHAEHGPRFLRTRTAPVHDAQGKVIGAVKVASDATREFQLVRMREEFLRAAAHELRTPITVMKSSAEAARASEANAATLRRLLEAVVRGADRIDRLVSSLLDLVELEGGMLRIARAPFRLDALVSDLVGQLAPRQAARVDVHAQPVQLRGDRHKLQQTLHALLDNAFKYSPSGAPVELDVGQRDGWAVLSVRDHGIGIPEGQRSRVFQKYHRAHAGTAHDQGGLGVGLYVAREVVEQHGGHVGFDTREPGGTTFFIELPIEGPPPE